MVKVIKTGRTATTGKAVTQPIGKGKSAWFAAVEGLKMSAASKELVRSLAAQGLKGDAYRAEVLKRFRKT